MINVPSTAQKMSDDYAALGNWIGLATDDPGNTSAPSNEVTVGSDPSGGYSRQQTTWTSGSGGVNTGSAVTFNVPMGTYKSMILCSDQTGDTMIDNCPISASFNAEGQIVVIPQYTQT